MTTIYYLVAILIADPTTSYAKTLGAYPAMDECFEQREVQLKKYKLETANARAAKGLQAICVAKDEEVI